MKTIEAVKLYNILKDIKLCGIDTPDRMNIIINLRVLKDVVEKYNSDTDITREILKPNGLDALLMKALESNEVVSSGGMRTITNEEIAKLNHMTEQFNRDMKAFHTGIFNAGSKVFEGGIDNEEIEIGLVKLSEKVFAGLSEANKDIPAESLMIIYDLLIA